MELFTAAIVSLLVQVAKYASGGQMWKTYALLALFSIVGGFTVSLLKFTGMWETAMQIAVYSAGIWALIIRRFEASQ